MRRLLTFGAIAALFTAVAVLAPAPLVSADTAPRTTVNAIEGEVMCPVCGTLLELAESPQAQREKAYVAKLVAQGGSKAEIKDALVAQYGPSVLALPEASGFDLTAYLIPIVAILGAAVAVALGVRGWRRSGDRGEPEDEPPEGPSGEDAERLEADLSRYDL
jgi:cytochrome c-type biogenesis protein CcmH